jgi:hypothetical protein
VPDISLAQRQEVAKLAERHADDQQLLRRRTRRVAQSLVVSAVRLGQGFVPQGDAFKIMVCNLSREGIGLVHDESFDVKHIALELSPQSAEPIQVIVRLIRQQLLDDFSPYVEIGGEFHIRLGSVATE